jgi:RNA polymerase sigma factor (sigma-70 family)
MRKGRSKGLSVAALPAKAVYERYASQLKRYLVRRVQRPEDVADLTQEIFELFVRRKERLEVVRNPLAYLFRIAFHVVGAALADEQRNPVTFDSHLLAQDQDAETPASSDEEAEELAVQEDMRAALHSLPRGYLTALLMVDGRGMSYKQAAQVSGFTPNTVATYVMQGRIALRLALDGRRKGKD